MGGASVPPMQFLGGHQCMRVTLTGSWTKFLNHYSGSIPVSTWELATIKMYIIKSLLCSYHDYKNWTLLIRIGIDTQNYTKACVMCEVGEGAKFYHLLKYFVKIFGVRGTRGWGGVHRDGTSAPPTLFLGIHLREGVWGTGKTMDVTSRNSGEDRRGGWGRRKEESVITMATWNHTPLSILTWSLTYVLIRTFCY